MLVNWVSPCGGTQQYYQSIYACPLCGHAKGYAVCMYCVVCIVPCAECCASLYCRWWYLGALTRTAGVRSLVFRICFPLHWLFGSRTNLGHELRLLFVEFRGSVLFCDAGSRLSKSSTRNAIIRRSHVVCTFIMCSSVSFAASSHDGAV
jgi:hypothetical protein